MNTGSVAKVLRPFSFRGKARLLHSLCPREGEREANLFGYRITLDLTDYIQRSMYLGTYEPFESSLTRDHLKAGMTFVDVGANVGYYSLLAASLVGGKGQVLAFEPSPYAFGRLKETIVANKLSQVMPIQAALGNVSEEMQLFLPNKPGNHTPTMVPHGSGPSVQVPVLKLDDCLDKYEIDKVDLVKIDVEGFEPDVIGGARKQIHRGRIRAILCELNQEWLELNGSSSSLLFKTLISLGFRTDRTRLNPRAPVQNILFTFG